MVHIKRKKTKTKTVLIDGKRVSGVVGQKKGESRIEKRRKEERRRNKARREDKKVPIRLEKKKGVVRKQVEKVGDIALAGFKESTSDIICAASPIINAETA